MYWFAKNLFWTIGLAVAALCLVWRDFVQEHRKFFLLLVGAAAAMLWLHDLVQRGVTGAARWWHGHPQSGDTAAPTFATAFADGLQLTFMLSLVAFVVLRSAILHGSPIGEHLEQAGYATLRLMLTTEGKEHPPVVVIDTSDVPVVDVPGPNGTHLRVTDRKPLREFLDKATSPQNVKKKLFPRAIGIDINFHGADNQFLSPDDGAFFDFCLSRVQACRERLSRKADEAAPDSEFNIYLGVRDTTGKPVQSWFTKPAYDTLAAQIAVPRHDAGRLFSSMVGGDDPPALPLGAALAEVDRYPPPSSLVLTVFSEQEIPDAGKAQHAETFLVDYSWLKALRAQTRPLADYLQSPDLVKALAGRIVLLGDVRDAPISDAFVVPGEEEPVPGVYLHACAAATLVEQPLYEPREAVSNSADLVLVVLLLIWLTYIRSKNPHGDAHGGALPPAFGLAAVAAVATSFLLVKYHVVWPDFLVVAFLVAIHPLIEWCAHTFRHSVQRLPLPGRKAQGEVPAHAKSLT